MSIQIQKAVKQFTQIGWGVIPDFISSSACSKAVREIDLLIDRYNPSPQQMLSFNTNHDDFKSSDYYLQSGDKIRFFLEEGATENGKFKTSKKMAIHKLGHGLHQRNQLFHRITYQKRILQICNACGILEPTVIQAIAILKQPKFGSPVITHQDSSFIFDQPLTLMGFWVPLEDATIQNGCLWGLPYSHKSKLYMRSFMDWKEKKAVMKQFHEKDYNEKDFVPIELKKGSLAFFNGIFLHKSQANNSQKSRYAYTWHLKEKNTRWPENVWLQREFPQFQYSFDAF